MPAFRGRTHDADWDGVTLNPLAIPGVFWKHLDGKRATKPRTEKFQRSTRLFILILGLITSWALVIYFASLVL